MPIISLSIRSLHSDMFTRMLINEHVATIVILLLTVKFCIVHNCSLHTLSRPADLSRGSDRTMNIRVTPYRKGRQLEFYCSCGGTGCVCNPPSPVFRTTATCCLGFQVYSFSLRSQIRLSLQKACVGLKPGTFTGISDKLF